ncbi:MAG: undecaprenyldiphospho-muramoylpentapeptide beta-N-acetylglucosaminyltransferase [Proteobacteria bacterium]|nr:undecaprenyldiphospho-muramoylpentapeptide beta-N-acetylglucosaminyltransferase [Pseudomonadota bacterium]MDA1323367.1 undecaprenyldiphospho-muramoylpentapeptide beta-N-acetylglucosaminyltransferase [Pseudomonadota bacterium]
MTARGPIVLAAGGTGGHVFPAQALAEVLSARGWRIALLTDTRGTAFGDQIGGLESYRIKAARIGGGAWSKLKGLTQLGLGFFQARGILRRIAPSVAVGFGGYPSVPTMWAATGARIPTLLHEQNAVLGRANRLLASRVDRIATSFDPDIVVSRNERGKALLTGNPVRAAIREIANAPYPARKTGNQTLSLLIFGGSQGARILSDVVPAAIATLPEAAREKLQIVQQCRGEDLDRVRRVYSSAGIKADLAPFFDDMPRRLAAAHLVIARAGASTIAEVTVAGRPIILVPYKHAMDDHQTANARAIDATGGGWMMPEDVFTEATLAAKLKILLTDLELLPTAAARARDAGWPDAAERLADATEALATSPQGITP